MSLSPNRELFFAAKLNHVEIVSVLLNHGAAVDIKSNVSTHQLATQCHVITTYYVTIHCSHVIWTPQTLPRHC